MQNAVNISGDIKSMRIRDFTTLVKTVGDSSTPEAIASSPTFFTTAIIMGKKAVRTVNANTVYLGDSATNDTQALDIGIDDKYHLVMPAGTKGDLSRIYVDVTTNGDGVVVLYW